MWVRLSGMYACIRCTLRVNLVVNRMANSLVEKDVGVLTDTKLTTSQQCAFATQQPQLRYTVLVGSWGRWTFTTFPLCLALVRHLDFSPSAGLLRLYLSLEEIWAYWRWMRLLREAVGSPSWSYPILNWTQPQATCSKWLCVKRVGLCDLQSCTVILPLLAMQSQ